MPTPKQVLVVDDEEGIRDILDLILSVEGYEVLTASHGAAALSLLDRACPAVILLDMKMPVMDGWEFARVYRGRPGRHAPIVVLTAAVDAAQRAAEVAAADYLGKPCRLDDLVRIVARLADEAQARFDA
jgi:CheY-like chemotaxis protein